MTERTELREFWLDSDGPAIPCLMSDGKVGLLIRGPTDFQVARGDWRFGFQVPGEDDVRWRDAGQIKIEGRGLIEQSSDAESAKNK